MTASCRDYRYHYALRIAKAELIVRLYHIPAMILLAMPSGILSFPYAAYLEIGNISSQLFSRAAKAHCNTAHTGNSSLRLGKGGCLRRR